MLDPWSFLVGVGTGVVCGTIVTVIVLGWLLAGNCKVRDDQGADDA